MVKGRTVELSVSRGRWEKRRRNRSWKHNEVMQTSLRTDRQAGTLFRTRTHRFPDTEVPSGCSHVEPTLLPPNDHGNEFAFYLNSGLRYNLRSSSRFFARNRLDHALPHCVQFMRCRGSGKRVSSLGPGYRCPSSRLILLPILLEQDKDSLALPCHACRHMSGNSDLLWGVRIAFMR